MPVRAKTAVKATSEVKGPLDMKESVVATNSRGRTIEITDTAAKIAAANRQVEEMRRFYERAGKDFDGKGVK